MKSCWVTGGAGFLGSHLCEALLAEGWRVGTNDNLSGGDIANVPGGAYFKNFDCLGNSKGTNDFDTCWSGEYEFGVPDVVVHCAALAHEGLSSFSPHLITQSIFGASVRTISQAIAHGVKRIVFMSSMSRYGNGRRLDPCFRKEQVGMLPFLEDDIPAPVDPYGIAKVAAEDALKILCETHGVKWSILTPHNILGTRQRYIDPFRNVASIFINRVLQGKQPLVYGDGNQKRCFSPVADCLPSIVKAVYGEADFEVINIGPDGGEITIKELAGMILWLCGSDLEIQYMSPRPNEVHQAYCSSDKARRLLGYKPVQSLEDCLKEMIDDIRRKGPKPFEYRLPLEIVTEKTPKTWTERLI